MREVIYEIGCGNKKLFKNSIGVDVAKFPGVSLVCDLNKYPWPIRSNSADKIIAYHIIEHLDDLILVLKEIHRILKLGACVEIRVPHFSSPLAWTDPTHKKSFGVCTFFYFDPGHAYFKLYGSYPGWPSFRVLERKLSYYHYSCKPRSTISKPFVYLINKIANFMPYPFEKYFSNYVGGMDEIYFKIQKVAIESNEKSR